MIARFAVVLLLLVSADALAADNKVIGTVEFTLDGEAQQWYVLESPDETRSSSLWLTTGPGTGAFTVTAFDRPDIELVRDERTGSAVPTGSAPALVISIGFPVDAGEQSYSLPIDQTAGPAVVMLLNDWSNPIDSMTLSDGPGEISLDSISAREDGPSAFSGTFSGALRNGEGDSRLIESGRFDLRKVTYFERP